LIALSLFSISLSLSGLPLASTFRARRVRAVVHLTSCTMRYSRTARSSWARPSRRRPSPPPHEGPPLSSLLGVLATSKVCADHIFLLLRRPCSSCWGCLWRGAGSMHCPCHCRHKRPVGERPGWSRGGGSDSVRSATLVAFLLFTEALRHVGAVLDFCVG
jgi:hypothetical protein